MLTLRELYEAAENWRERRRIHFEILKMERKKRKIVLVAGHHRAGFWHGKDPGAMCPFDKSTCEHYECEKIVYQAKEVLKRDGFTVVVLPFDLDLSQKMTFINEHFRRNDLLFSVHLNAFLDSSVSGTETFILKGDSEIERNAKVVQNILVKTLGLTDRGVKYDAQSFHGWLHLLRYTVVKEAYLLELGFITNKKDLEAVRKTGVQAVVDAAKAGFYW